MTTKFFDMTIEANKIEDRDILLNEDWRENKQVVLVAPRKETNEVYVLVVNLEGGIESISFQQNEKVKISRGFE